jgi:hypothetical protein
LRVNRELTFKFYFYDFNVLFQESIKRISITEPTELVSTTEQAKSVLAEDEPLAEPMLEPTESMEQAKAALVEPEPLVEPMLESMEPMEQAKSILVESVTLSEPMESTEQAKSVLMEPEPIAELNLEPTEPMVTGAEYLEPIEEQLEVA